VDRHRRPRHASVRDTTPEQLLELGKAAGVTEVEPVRSGLRL
jgi:hypothetical protein